MKLEADEKTIKSKFGQPDYIWDENDDQDSDFPGYTMVYERGRYALRFIDHDGDGRFYLIVARIK